MLLLFSLASLPALAGTFINFDVPGAVYTIAYAINNSGDAAGNWSDGTATHGFLRRVDGTITSFDISRGTQTSVTGINSAGMIVGYYFGTDNAYHGFTRNLAGGLTTINAPGAGWKNYGGTYALSINDAGQVAGFYVDNGGTEHGFFRDALGNYSTCDPPGSVNALGLMLNQAGELVGNYYTADTLIHGFLRDAAGDITVFDAGGAGLYAWTVAINASGQITGYYYDHSSNGGHGFVRNPDGSVTSFDIQVPGYTPFPIGIQDSGDVIGSYQPYNLQVWRGFRYSAAGVATAFRDPDAAPWAVNHIGAGTFPHSVSGNGKIAGDYIDRQGIDHGFVWKQN